MHPAEIQPGKDQRFGELCELCSELMAPLGDGKTLSRLRYRSYCWYASAIFLILFIYLMIFLVLSTLTGGLAWSLVIGLGISMVSGIFQISARRGSELRHAGGFENELKELSTVIAQHKTYIVSANWDDLSIDDRHLAIRAFMRYSLRCLSVSILEKATLVPVGNKEPNRFVPSLGARYYGTFEPDPLILMVLGKLITIDARISSHLDYSVEIGTLIGDLNRLRIPTGERIPRKTMADDAYTAVQAQFVQYLGRYGDANSLRVLRTLARDKRYPGLQAEAKLAIDRAANLA